MSFFRDYNLCSSTVLSFVKSCGMAASYCGLAASAAAQDTASDEAFANMMESMASEMAADVIAPVVTDPVQTGTPVCMEELATSSETTYILIDDDALAKSLECMNGQVVYVSDLLSAADS